MENFLPIYGGTPLDCLKAKKKPMLDRKRCEPWFLVLMNEGPKEGLSELPEGRPG